MSGPPDKACLILHKKTCMRPDVVQAIEALEQSDFDLMVRIPWSRSDMKMFMRQAIADGVTRIIAGGGDGTLNDIANFLMKKDRAQKTSLGVFPLGTANDFARGAEIPANDLTAALHLAATGTATPIDIGEVNGRCFINVASGGFGAEITATTPKDLKKALGGAAYTLMGLAKVINLQPYIGRYTDPDGRTEEASVIVMAVGNNRFAGGGFEVAPKANMQDGLLDFSVLSSDGAPDPRVIAAELADPFNSENRYLRYHQASTFTFESDRPLHMNLDGEPMLESRFEFKTHPRALEVVLGDRAQ